MSGLLPSVPINTTSRDRGSVSETSIGATPVTRSTSARRSVAARLTPAKSLLLTYRGMEVPRLDNPSAPFVRVVVTYESATLAAGAVPCAPTRTSRNAALVRRAKRRAMGTLILVVRDHQDHTLAVVESPARRSGQAVDKTDLDDLRRSHLLQC